MNLIGFYDKDERMNQALNFIYVNEKQVSRENQRDLIFKLKFLQTQQHLAIKGRFQEIMRKFHSLLELDMAGFDPKLTKKLNQIKNRELREIQTEKVKRYIMMHACIIMRKLILRKRIKSLKTMNEKYSNPRQDIWERKIKCEKMIESNQRYFKGNNKTYLERILIKI